MPATTTEDRMERMEKTKKILKSICPAAYKEARASISLNVCVSERKAEEYLRVLQDGGYLKLKDGMIEIFF